MAFAYPEIIRVFDNIKYPYNLSGVIQELAIEALKNLTDKDKMIAEIVQQRAYLRNELTKLPMVKRVYPSEANFLLVQVTDAEFLYKSLIQHKIIIRNRSNLIHCDNCVRITVGTTEENRNLINTMKSLDE